MKGYKNEDQIIQRRDAKRCRERSTQESTNATNMITVGDNT